MSERPARPRILCVDDEPNLLAGLARSLRVSFDVVTAVGALTGLEEIAKSTTPFSVVISDLRMPGMDGVAFLHRVRHEAPDAVRVLLTGQADMASAIGAVNDGQIFRFLLKPCPPETLLKTLHAACEQYRLITAERVLLEQTVQGCIKALIELLAIAQPAAFGRSTRVKRHAGAIAERIGLPDRWQVEVAALLSQVGCMTLPTGTAERLYSDDARSEEDQRTAERLPELAARLVSSIPRLDGVVAILQHQHTPYMARPVRAPGAPPAAPDVATSVAPRSDVPLGARVLRAALDLDVLELQGYPLAQAVGVLESRRGVYDPGVLTALRALHEPEASSKSRVVEIPLGEVQLGMIFARDVVAPNGLLLIARGQEVTPSLVDCVRNHWSRLSAAYQVLMIIPAHDDGAGAATTALPPVAVAEPAATPADAAHLVEA